MHFYIYFYVMQVIHVESSQLICKGNQATGFYMNDNNMENVKL